MTNGKLLWVDDEVNMLKAHIIFLEQKGYEVTTLTNGYDAVEQCQQEDFDLVLLDENMPGLSGLETLQRIKDIRPDLPVVMVTKSEEENIMNQAIGAKIADYLIKPVNPNQILLTLKKNIHKSEIVAEVAQTNYRQDFGRIGMQISDSLTPDEWKDVYRRLVYWELELAQSSSPMSEMLAMQKEEANQAFAKFVRRHYADWIQQSDERPMMSMDVFKKVVFPLLNEGQKVFLLVLDNFRYDQWRVFSHELAEDFSVTEDLYYSILPTVTQYARNALFAGLTPAMIRQMYPQLWVDEEEDEGKNQNEEQLIAEQLRRYRRKERFSYHKLQTSQAASLFLQNQFAQLSGNELNVVVINFIDMLSHARTESEMVRELAANEAAYRGITLSWLKNTSVQALFRALAESNYTIVLTTDHGSIRVSAPSKVVGERTLNTNLRYKVGRQMSYNNREVFEVREPLKVGLPAPKLSSTYIFATGSRFFAYPNNYNYYVQYYQDTFQHGGLSMEEMIVPIVTLRPRRR